MLQAVARGEEPVGELRDVVPALRVIHSRIVPGHVVRELPLVSEELLFRGDSSGVERCVSLGVQGLCWGRRFKRGLKVGL